MYNRHKLHVFILVPAWCHGRWSPDVATFAGIHDRQGSHTRLYFVNGTLVLYLSLHGLLVLHMHVHDSKPHLYKSDTQHVFTNHKQRKENSVSVVSFHEVFTVCVLVLTFR